MLALTGLLVLLVVGVVVLPQLLYPPLSRTQLQEVPTAKERIELQQAQSELQNNARTPLLQGLGGLLLVGGLIATWQQVLISREGQVTERFTRAVDQLGSQAVDVRTGGIYALERIGRDSAADRATVVEVLTACVRHHAPWPPKAPPHDLAASGDSADVARLQTRAPDVHAAMTVLGRAPWRDRNVELQLNDTDLRKAYLPRANLQGAFLHQVHLEDARLRHVVLRKANLTDAYLRDAWMLEANLERAGLHGAHLERAKLQGAWLLGANLEDARLHGAHLERAVLRDADLRGARLSNADLRGADLRGADLRGADLRGVGLEGADLTGVREDAETKWPAWLDADRRGQAGVVTDGGAAPEVSPTAGAT
jgi:uncharacterized protein YjbI with pentapeptide repeats